MLIAEPCFTRALRHTCRGQAGVLRGLSLLGGGLRISVFAWLLVAYLHCLRASSDFPCLEEAGRQVAGMCCPIAKIL